MPIFDTHCHYNLDPLFADWKNHWQKAQNENVKKSVIIGVDVSTSQRAVEMAATDENLYAAVGIHPNEWGQELTLDNNEVFNDLENLLPNNKIVAVGETGLDYYWLTENIAATKEKQKGSLITHIELAFKAKLPLILHVRDKETPEIATPNNAYWDTLSILEEQLHPDQPFILHCVSGPQNYLKKALELGAYIGVAGNVTYKNAEAIRELVRLVPQNRLLLETDAPFLPPQQFRGKVCEPWMITHTEHFLNEYMGIPTEHLYENAVELFTAKRAIISTTEYEST